LRKRRKRKRGEIMHLKRKGMTEEEREGEDVFSNVHLK